MFFTRRPWRKIQIDPVVVTVGEATLTICGKNGMVSVEIDAPDHIKITRSESAKITGHEG
jgi:sRNA-binding carbon storage regulator CsrA